MKNEMFPNFRKIKPLFTTEDGQGDQNSLVNE